MTSNQNVRQYYILFIISLVLSFDTDSLSAMIMGTRAVNETSRKFTMSEEGPYLGPYRKIYEDIMSQRYSWVIRICSLVFFNYSCINLQNPSAHY